MTIKLPQGCPSTNIKEANAAFLAASNKQFSIIPVRGTIGGIFEARKCLNRFLRIASINVDLAKQEDIIFTQGASVEKKQHSNLTDSHSPSRTL